MRKVLPRQHIQPFCVAVNLQTARQCALIVQRSSLHFAAPFVESLRWFASLAKLGCFAPVISLGGSATAGYIRAS
jgi:hypothetical protein